MTMLQMTPLRCRFCRCRFFRHLPPGTEGLGTLGETESKQKN